MEISDIIALLAFFISLYGAIVSTSLALSENLNLKLKYLNENFLTLALDNKVVDNHGEYLGSYNKTAYTIAIKVRIVNKSKSPTTINEFILNNKYNPITIFTYFFVLLFGNSISNIDITIIARTIFFAHELIISIICVSFC